MKNEKPVAVYSAIIANLVIAAMKFIVSFITGSSAMLAEAIHSTADTGNELLLLLGFRRSRKPANDKHPLGYGRELYFWSLIVALVLFSAGAGMSIYEGITRLSHPGEMKAPGWNYAVLAVGFLADGSSWLIARRELLKQQKAGESFWHNLRTSKDPSVFIVFGEDTADLAGLLTAFVGILLGQLLHSGYPDVIASILVGLILALVAIYLVYESKSLLIGETADAEMVAAVQKIIESHAAVEKAEKPLTVHLSPNNIFVALDVELKPDLSSTDVAAVVTELKKNIHQEYENVGRIFIEVERDQEKEQKRE